MAGRRGSIATVSHGWSLVFALVALLIARTSLADPARVYDIDLRTRSVADALNDLSEQTGVPVVFPYDLVKDQKANPVVGHYTLLEALNELLKDTGLSGGISEKGVVTISLAKSAPPTSGEIPVPHDDNKQHTKKTTRVDKRAPIAAFFASIAAAFSAAAAEDAADVDNEQDKMSSVVVTAEKQEERLQDVPMSLTVLDPQTLAENGQNRLVDYFASVPGLNMSAGGNGENYFTIRGLSTGNPGDSGNPTVATVIDDVPMTSDSERGYGANTFPDIDPSDLARIEVLKGPQGTLYGADSLGGLIKYVTLDPSTTAFTGRVEASGVDIPGGGRGYSVRGAVNVPVSDTFAVRASAFSRHDPGYIDDVTTGQRNFNYADVYGGHVAALWKPSQNLSVKLSGLIQETHGGASNFDSTISGQPIFADLGLTSLPGTTSYMTQDQVYTATVDWKAPGVDITSITGYVINTLKNWSDLTAILGSFAYDCDHEQLPNTCTLPPGAPPGVDGAPLLYDFNTHKVSEELRVGSSIGHWLDWRLGGFFTHENAPRYYADVDGANLTTGAIIGRFYDDQDTTQTFREYAFFGDFTAHVTDRFDIEFGGRKSWNRQEDQYLNTGSATLAFNGVLPPDVSPMFHSSGSAFTYQVTPKFQISQDLMIYARIATGYRIGGYNLDAFLPTLKGYGVPTSFAPDKTRNYELGIKEDLLEHKLSFAASAYYIDWTDIQISLRSPFAGPDGTTITATYTGNGGKAKSEGLEASLEARPMRGLTITAQGSYDNAILTQNLPCCSAYGLAGERLPYSMRFSGGITANQDIPLSGDWIGFLGGSVNYIGSRPYEFTTTASQPRIEYPAYTQLNLRTGAHYQSWLTTLYINNVTDKRGIVGIQPGSNIGPTTGGYLTTVIQPRTVGLRVSKTF